MDETEYRRVYEEVNELRCAFEKAVLTRRFGCSRLARINIGEREAASCTHEPARNRCLALLERLRSSAAFALHTPHAGSPLPHAKEMKVQCGGLLGLQAILRPDEATTTGVADIHTLIDQAQTRFGKLAEFPYGQMVRTIGRFEIRRGRRRS
ncbi:MAG TPA: hypothetical protein ENK54_04275 [Thiotrichales bacterium]|nr:hypothetical protein [Thiotrichales bacterium]